MKIKLLPIIFCLFALPVFGQENEARKFDEFGNIPCDEYLARMDAAIVEAGNNPGGRVYVFVYEGKERRAVYKRKGGYQTVLPTRGSAKSRIESVRKYLKRRNFDPNRFVYINGGFRENFAVEIWSVPAGAEPPKASPTLGKMQYRKGKPARFCIECCGL